MINEVMQDAASFQEGLQAFELNDFSKQCPDTKLIYKEITNPDAATSAEALPQPDGSVYISITVRDYIDNSVVGGAGVYLPHSPKHTDSDGTALLGYLDPQAEYPVSIFKKGYVKSKADTLDNDTITTGKVQEPPLQGHVNLS